MRGGDEDMTQIPRQSAFARKGFGGIGGALRFIRVVDHFLEQPVKQRVQFR